MAEDQPSKTNGVTPDPMLRLASFKPPRDLTLGGVKTSKKVFTPNLNVTRNKNKGSAIKQNNQKKDDKDKRDRKNDKNKNFKNGPKVIKSTGVFSEGLANVERHSSRTYYGRDSDSSQTMQRPTIRVKDFVKMDKELEEQKNKAFVGDEDNTEDSDCEDFNVVDRTAPVQLSTNIPGKNKLKSKLKVKEEVVIKKEPDDPECNASNLEQKPPLANVKNEIYEDDDIVKLLNSSQPTFIFLQFPDTLPWHKSKKENEGPQHKFSSNEPSTSNVREKDEKGEKKQADTGCRFSDLEEGRLGKLRVHKSGRVSLMLGDTLFDVFMGTNASCQQEVVSVATDDASRSANLIALGSIQQKLILVPNWESLFNDAAI